MNIYKITNLVNGKNYIGQNSTDNPLYFGGGVLLKRAFKKYKIENFQKEIIAWCYTKEHLNFLETFYINFLNTKVPNGYNLASGGEGGDLSKFHDYKPHSEETKKKISNANKGIKRYQMTDEIRKKISEAIKKNPNRWNKGLKGRQIAWNKNKPWSEEIKRKISESHKGLISPNKGKKFSIEFCKKSSEAHKGQKAWNKGISWSEETKEKISRATKGRIPWNKGLRLGG